MNDESNTTSIIIGLAVLVLLLVDEDVDRDGNPDLRLHRVLRRAVELLDPKMLLDPLEEEFHLPAAFVERADGGGRKREVVGDEDQRLAGLGVLEADAPQKFGVILTGVEAVQGDGLVANDAGRAIRRRRIDAMSIDVRLGTRDEEGPGGTVLIIRFIIRRILSLFSRRPSQRSTGEWQERNYQVSTLAWESHNPQPRGTHACC